MTPLGKTTVSKIPFSRVKTVPGAKKGIQAFRKLKRGLFGKTHKQSIDFLERRVSKAIKRVHRSNKPTVAVKLSTIRVN